jgi:hypothetical protein
MDFKLFPAELRALPQWMVAGSGDASSKEYKRPIDPKTGKWGSPTDPATWGTFEQAMASPYPLKGFVFNDTDPFTVIDLDTYKAGNEQVKNLHAEIARHAETYAELSQSGLGTHIIGLGRVAEGANNAANALEVYSSGRFMICTGRPIGGQARPLADIQALLDYLYPLLKHGGTKGAVNWRDLGDGEESFLSDAEVVERASNAENGDKFDRLCAGDLSDYNGDWSDADAALIQFLCWYTPDNNQVRRIFMLSKLAERDKAHRADYVPRTIASMRAKIEQDAIPLVDAQAILDRAKAAAAPVDTTIGGPSVDTTIGGAPAPISAPPRPATFPPGIVGEIAEYVLAASIRPVPEVALATAIAVTAGIVGRNYNVSNTGLNQYLLLLAKTGTGKESVQSSVDRLFVEVCKTVPAAERFLGPAHFSSGPALVKQFQERPCFMSVLGEFGHRLKAMTHPRANGAEKTLMAAILDIYAKSGWGQMLRSSVYSDKEKNTQIVHAPALTLLGETEPDGFFANLDESTIASGFLPRFTVIEYTGDRPARNRKAWTAPPAELVTRVADMCSTVLSMEQNATCTVVQMDAAALKLLDIFDEFADAQIRGSNEVTRQLWNRAHLKALRLSALIAVGVNPYQATVTHSEAQWAIDLVKRDIASLLDRFAVGDVGEGDTKLQADITTVIRRYLSDPGDAWEAYHARGCIPIRFLQQRTGNRSAFKNHKLGANRALKDTLAAMVEAGLLVQVAKKQADEWFKTSSVVYAIGDHWEG